MSEPLRRQLVPHEMHYRASVSGRFGSVEALVHTDIVKDYDGMRAIWQGLEERYENEFPEKVYCDE